MPSLVTPSTGAGLAAFWPAIRNASRDVHLVGVAIAGIVVLFAVVDITAAGILFSRCGFSQLNDIICSFWCSKHSRQRKLFDWRAGCKTNIIVSKRIELYLVTDLSAILIYTSNHERWRAERTTYAFSAGLRLKNNDVSGSAVAKTESYTVLTCLELKNLSLALLIYSLTISSMYSCEDDTKRDAMRQLVRDRSAAQV